MRIAFYCPIGFEPWDYRNYTENGIGGSETCVCEMAWRLAQRGYEVDVYGSLGAGCELHWRGTRWHPLREVDPGVEALWVLCRCPHEADRHMWAGPVWVMCQDEDYPGAWTNAVAERVDIVMALSGVHGRHLARRNPQIAEKIGATSNGVRVDLFEALEREGIERDPHRLIWASSPDRGLAQAVLPLWPRIREQVDDAELHVYYGFDNIDKMVAGDPVKFGWLGKIRDDTKRMMAELPGVVWHGRVGQEELYRAWLSSAVWPQFSDFTETSCIACMEAQAGGAIPVTRPWWAIGENVKHGIFVNGSAYSDPLARARLADETAALLLDEGLQAAIRAEMMAEARMRCHWERIVDQWVAWMHGFPWPQARCQFSFQHQHREGLTLNVGCGNDYSDLRAGGNVWNVDVRRVDPLTGVPNRVDEVADARSLPYATEGFDTAILGDILEHVSDEDAASIIAEARRVARRVVITCPEDHRSVTQQYSAAQQGQRLAPDAEYAPGISAWHLVPMTRERLLGLTGPVAVEQPIRYDHCDGLGVVIEC